MPRVRLALLATALIEMLGIQFTRWLFSWGAVVGVCLGYFGTGMGLTLEAVPFWPKLLLICCTPPSPDQGTEMP